MSKRCANFSAIEVDMLLELVKDHKDILECKKTDKISSDGKINCWKKISEKFNATNQVFKSVESLKSKYENLKKAAKKNFAMDKLEIYKTGGGSKARPNANDVDQKVMEIVQEEQIVGLVSLYDDDSIGKKKHFLKKL